MDNKKEIDATAALTELAKLVRTQPPTTERLVRAWDLAQKAVESVPKPEPMWKRLGLKNPLEVATKQLSRNMSPDKITSLGIEVAWESRYRGTGRTTCEVLHALAALEQSDAVILQGTERDRDYFCAQVREYASKLGISCAKLNAPLGSSPGLSKFIMLHASESTAPPRFPQD